MADIIGNGSDHDINELALAFLEGKNGTANRNGKQSTKRRREKKELSEDILKLPGNGVTITDCARKLYDRLGSTDEWFNRGGQVVTLTAQGSGVCLQDIRPDEFRSVPEMHFDVYVLRALRDDFVLKRAVMSQEQAKAILACREGKEFLPEIKGLSGCPLLLSDGRLIGSGFDAKSGIYVTGDMTVELPSLSEARNNILALLEDFRFADDSDRARAIAEIISPALRLGGHLRLCPAFMNEGDQTQTGKGYKQKVIVAVYGETPRYVVQRQGGVGSFDESFGTRLSEGGWPIVIDNVRGRMDSTYFESMMTAEHAFPVRIPGKGEIMIDPSHFVIFMTSNAAEMTKDAANRCCIVRLRKQPQGFQFKKFPEGDLLDHVRANAGVYLGSILKVVSTWVEMGRPQVEDTPHDFRQWARSLDWIVRTIFKTAPLMQGHEQAKSRLSDPSQSFIRQLAVVVTETGANDRDYSATELFEIAEANSIPIPGLQGWDELQGPKRVGAAFRRVLADKPDVEIDGYKIATGKRDYWRPDGKGQREISVYRVSKSNFPSVPSVPSEVTTSEEMQHFHESTRLRGDQGGKPEIASDFYWPEGDE